MKNHDTSNTPSKVIWTGGMGCEGTRRSHAGVSFHKRSACTFPVMGIKQIYLDVIHYYRGSYADFTLFK
ncbi:MAG: hypothetical protein RTV72_00860 [Candidatus Thorarchaeota archaeon]